MSMVDAYTPDPGIHSVSSLQSPVLRHVLAKVRREQFETWFRSLRVTRADEREMEFSVTNQFVRDWILKNHLSTLQEAAGLDGQRRKAVLALRAEDGWDSLGALGLQPTVRTIDPTPPHQEGARLADLLPATGRPGGLGSNGARPAERRPNLNPNNTFDKFVVGPCNRLGHAAALAAGENPGHAFNPLFLHGNVGLGKTHLLQAICHAVQKRDPAARVLYMSCEDFTNTFIKAIQSGNLDEFRNFHRCVDVLVIDDVQYFANKDKTQDEFFHTFNSLYDAQKQIVISSDRPPTEIPTIEERLVSRFKWGLVAEIQTPCYETRVAIVRRKAKGRGVELGDDVSTYVAERITANIRELEGAVIKIVGVAAITGRPITRELAEEALRGVAVTRLTQVSVDDVMGMITSEFAISARDLTGKSRTQAISLPRQIAMFLLREHTEMSLEDIGRIFGNRDHTTVLYAVTKIRERTTTDRIFKDMLEGLGTRLLSRPQRS